MTTFELFMLLIVWVGMTFMVMEIVQLRDKIEESQKKPK